MYNDKYSDEGGWCVWSDETSGTPQAPSRHPIDIPRHHSATPRGTANKWQNLDFDLEACLKVYFVRLVQTPFKSLNLPEFEATISLRISKFSFGK